MVVPWIGYPLAQLIKRVEPTENAKFVEFTTLDDPRQMPGLQSNVIAAILVLLFWDSAEGQMMRFIPMTVTATLLASLLYLTNKRLWAPVKAAAKNG